MTSLAKVKTGAFTNEPQGTLADLCRTAYLLMFNNPVYKEPFKVLLEVLDTCIKDYEVALAESKNRDAIKVTAKDVKKKALIQAMRNIALELNAKANGDVSFIINAGFSVPDVPTAHRGPMATPIISKASNTMEKGQARIVLDKKALSPGTINVWVEISTDKGLTWTSGKIFSNTRILLEGLETTSDLRVRVKALGTNNRSSGFSTPASCSVL